MNSYLSWNVNFIISTSGGTVAIFHFFVDARNRLSTQIIIEVVVINEQFILSMNFSLSTMKNVYANVKTNFQNPMTQK